MQLCQASPVWCLLPAIIHERLIPFSQIGRLRKIKNNLWNLDDLFYLLQKSLVENLPVIIMQDGEVIADNYDAMLDELRNLSNNNIDFTGFRITRT